MIVCVLQISHAEKSVSALIMAELNMQKMTAGETVIECE